MIHTFHTTNFNIYEFATIYHFLVPRKIHHLSYPAGSSANDYIATEASSLSYSSLQRIFNTVAHYIQWLLGFLWRGRYYQEICLPFGLCTAPFIFNLFAEAFHWILELDLYWSVDHYLDDFIAVLSASEATPSKLCEYNAEYKTLLQTSLESQGKRLKIRPKLLCQFLECK